MPRKKTTPATNNQQGEKKKAASAKVKASSLMDLDSPLNDNADELDPILAEESGRPDKNLWELRQEEAAYAQNKADAQRSRLISARYLTALQRHTFMESTIASVDFDENTAYWVCYDEDVLIRIPCSESFDDLDEHDHLTTDGNVKTKLGFLSRCIGATITYAVKDVQYSEKDGVCYVTGSRVEALRKIRRRYFGSTAEKPVQVGDIVRAQVVSSGDYACRVNFYGIDTRLENKDITYRYVPNVESMYPPGTMLDVMVLAIEGTDKKPEVIVSGIRAERLGFQKRYYRIKPGLTSRATVKSIRLNKNVTPATLTITMYLDDVELPGFANTIQLDFINRIKKGTTVKVRVEEITPKTGFLRCKIIQVNSPLISNP